MGGRGEGKQTRRMHSCTRACAERGDLRGGRRAGHRIATDPVVRDPAHAGEVFRLGFDSADAGELT